MATRMGIYNKIALFYVFFKIYIIHIKVPMPSFDDLIEAYKKAQEIYLENGITTVQDGMTYQEMIPIYQKLVNDNMLKIDLILYIKTSEKEKFIESFKENFIKYNKNLKIGGYKIFLDGSPQSRTAWMRTPYFNDPNYFGYGTMDESELDDVIKRSYDENIQILAHCNGDKAAEQYFEENQKGSIKEGKNADLIIIDKNPLKIKVDEIKDIKILCMIKDGKTIYKMF